MNRFECSVCTGEYLDAQRFECPACAYVTCKSCQKTYLRPQCMNCRVTFTRAHLLSSLGKSWVTGPLKKHSQELLITREKSRIPATMGEVRRVRAKRALKEKARFAEYNNSRTQSEGEGGEGDEEKKEEELLKQLGIVSPLLAKNRRKLTHAVIPCPVEDCRGFLQRGVCSACNVKTCLSCLKPLPPTTSSSSSSEGGNNGHGCDLNDVSSVAFMLKDSKPCPNCGVFIHKTMGCRHMHCTHCNAHWDWDTGKLMERSTNWHYMNLQRFARDVATIARRPQSRDERTLDNSPTERDAAGECGDDVEDDPVLAFDDAVARDRVSATTHASIMRALYDDPMVVRYTVRRMYDIDRLHENHGAALVRLRTLYIMNEIDETAWSRRLFTAEHAFERDNHVARVLLLYLFTVRDLQRQLARRVIDGTDRLSLLDSYYSLVCICNQSLASLREEYGGPRIVVRENVGDHDAPPLFIQ